MRGLKKEKKQTITYSYDQIYNIKIKKTIKQKYLEEPQRKQCAQENEKRRKRRKCLQTLMDKDFAQDQQNEKTVKLVNKRTKRTTLRSILTLTVRETLKINTNNNQNYV